MKEVLASSPNLYASFVYAYYIHCATLNVLIKIKSHSLILLVPRDEILFWTFEKYSTRFCLRRWDLWGSGYSFKPSFGPLDLKLLQVLARLSAQFRHRTCVTAICLIGHSIAKNICSTESCSMASMLLQLLLLWYVSYSLASRNLLQANSMAIFPCSYTGRILL